MNSIHRSMFFSAIERYGNVICFIVSTAVLSRLLTPQEFGIYAVVGALSTVAIASFQEFGGANYLIQKASLSERDVRTAFTITLCLSLVLAAIMVELSDPAARFFSEDGLRIGIAVSALNFIFTPFSMTISALLRRDLLFGTIARCNLAGSFMNASVSIALAASNYSFMAPIWGTIVGNAAVALLLIASWRDLRIFLPSFRGYRDVLGFGAFSSGTIIVNVCYNFAPQLILARVLDFNSVGLYSRALSTTQVFDRLVTQAVSPVILPAVAARTRTGGDLKRIYLDSIELLSAVQWPFLGFFVLMATPIVSIWLGPTWTEVVPLIRMLSIASLSLFAACLTYPILVAAGSVRDTLVSSLISLPPSLLLIFLASFLGVRAVAAAALIAFPFQAIVALWFIRRRLALGLVDVGRAILRSGVVAAFSIAGVLVSLGTVGFISSEPIVELLSAGIFAVAGWFLGLAVTNHPLLAQIRLVASSIAAGTPKLRLVGRRMNLLLGQKSS